MATYKLRRFSKPEVLKRLKPELLSEFLNAHREALETRGVMGTSADDLDYEQLVNIFMHPNEGDEELAEALYVVDEMATASGMDALMKAAELAGLSLCFHDDSPTEVALRFWLHHREILERKYAESLLTRVRSFESCQARTHPPPDYQPPSPEVVRALEADLDTWFEAKNRGTGSKLYSFPRPDAIWFLVRHGEPLRREGTMEEGERSIVVYRPEKYNILVYHPRSGELEINAPSVGEKDLYREKFAEHLFGILNLFSSPGRYDLEPLREQGEASLVCSDVEGMQWVKLREVAFFWGGSVSEIEVRQAKDLFKIYGPERRRRFPKRPRLIRAKFEVKFTEAKASRRLTVLPPSKAQYTRDDDKMLLEDWMSRRGFLRAVGDEAA